MTTSGVGSAVNVLNVSPLDPLQATSGAANLSMPSGTSQTDGISGGLAGGTPALEISGTGQLLSKLQELKTKDPAKFKQVLSDISSQLRALSQQQGQNSGSQWLAKLADRFQTAANTGDLSALQPHGHPHGHHHRHGASGAYGKTGSQDQQALQQALTNQGGSSASDPLRSQLSSIFAEIDTALSQ